ncbi:MAG: prephenate dehydrogenase/arogenate dehydrogenase family protein [bacterium]
MRIAIIGVGHMGSWLANELKTDHQVAVYDVDLKIARTIDDVEVLMDLESLDKFRPEMLINAVSIRETIPVFKSVTKYLPKDCVLADVTSVKGTLSAYYKSCGFEFASVHPMFGPTFANIQNLKEENAIIISESNVAAKDFFKMFFYQKGINIFEFSFDEHDKMIAYSLTLPFASTMVFAACMENKTVPGTTFKRHLAIAKGVLSEDDFLLADILFNKYSIKELDKVTSRLEFLKHVIKGRDYEEAVKFFNGLRDNIKKS